MRDEPRQSEEAALVLGAQAGDSDAFRTLIESYDCRLLYYIRRVLGEAEEAFDVLQEVWPCAHRNLRKLQSPRAFRVWLRDCAEHARDCRRKRSESCAVNVPNYGNSSRETQKHARRARVTQSNGAQRRAGLGLLNCVRLDHCVYLGYVATAALPSCLGCDAHLCQSAGRYASRLAGRVGALNHSLLNGFGRDSGSHRARSTGRVQRFLPGRMTTATVSLL
jgi:hypothetical protein